MANTYPTTQFPLGSTEVKVLFNNASNFDDAMNSELPSWYDRFNKRRETWAGMQKLVTDFLEAMGFEATHLVYVDGTPLTVLRPTQLIDRAGSVYKVKQPATFPVELSGTWATDQLLLVDVGDASLRMLLASPDGAKNVFDGTRSVHDALLSTPVSVAPGDGVADDVPEILTALGTSSHIVFPVNAAGYAIKSNFTVTLTQDTVIDFNGQVCRFDGGRISLSGDVIATGRTLAVDAPRFSNSITVDNGSDIQQGDLLFITTTISPSSDWIDRKKDCVMVKFVTGSFINLAEALNFGYTTADSGLTITVYRPVKLTLKNANFLMVAPDDATPRVMVDLYGLHGVTIDTPTIKGQYPFTRDTNVFRVGIQTLACRDVQIDRPTYEAMSYQIGCYWGTRYITEKDVNANYCHHGHADVGDWSSDYRLSGMKTTDCFQALSTHPCFRAFAENFDVYNDFGLSNMRCIGGGMRNGIIRSLVNDTAELPQYQNMPMVAGYTDMYSEADFYCDNVNWQTLRVNEAEFGVRYGRTVTVSNTKCIDIMTSFGARNDVVQLIIGPGNRIGPNYSRTPGSALTLCPARIDVDAPLDAYLESGVYHVDPRKTMVPHANGRLACSGSVYTNRAGASPLATSLVLHVNAFSDASQANVVSGKLKLFSTVVHQSAGVFSTQEKHFNFSFNVQATSAIYFPTTAIYTSGLSGQAGEGVVITISAPAFSGVSQIGANGDHTITVPITLTAAGTSPVFSLSYELELDRAL